VAKMLKKRGLKLDVVIELVVDDKALVGRIAKRADETKAAGKPVRKDDDPAVFPERLREYYKKTAPLTGYYYAKGLLKGVDGMASIDDVTEAIESVLEQAVKKAKK
jgi:adenylate kinase